MLTVFSASFGAAASRRYDRLVSFAAHVIFVETFAGGHKFSRQIGGVLSGHNNSIQQIGQSAKLFPNVARPP